MRVGATQVSALLGVPGSVGVSLQNGTLGLLVYPGGTNPGTYAVVADGQVSLVGVPGLTIAGTIHVRANTTTREDIAETLNVGGQDVPLDFGAGEGLIHQFEGDPLTLSTPVASLTGHFVFVKDGMTNEVTAAGTGIAFAVGTPTVGVRVLGAQFALLLKPDRTYAFDAGGNASVIGVPSLVFNGALHAQKNTTGLDVNRAITAGTLSVTLDVKAGVSRFGADNVMLSTPAGDVSGNFVIETTTAGPDGIVGNADDTTELLIGATGVRLFVGDNTDPMNPVGRGSRGPP